MCASASLSRCSGREKPSPYAAMHVYGAFNVEPALYLEGYCGMRHCGMVVVTQDGAEVLTAFQTAPADLRLDARRLNSGS